MDKFDSINVLRSMNKFHNNEINMIFSNFWNGIQDCLSSPKTLLLKNILFFVHEVFQAGVNKNLDEKIIENLFPIVLRNSFNPSTKHKFIKVMCRDIIKIIVQNYICNTTIMCLCEQVMLGFKNSKQSVANKDLAENSLHLLIEVLSQLDTNISKCSEWTISCLASTLDHVLVNAPKKCQKLAKQAARFLASQMGKNNYFLFVEMLASKNMVTSPGGSALLNKPF